jgi:sensor domain CHASE-containing protein
MTKVTKEVIKERGLRIGLNQIVTYATLVPIFWFIVQPLLVNALAEEMQESIKQTVQQEIKPINAAFVALLQTNIANTRRKIARLEFKRDQPPNGDWTSQDAEDMVNLQLELASSESALTALTTTSTS